MSKKNKKAKKIATVGVVTATLIGIVLFLGTLVKGFDNIKVDWEEDDV